MTSKFHRVVEEDEVNIRLAPIVAGYIGFDTEYASRTPSDHERIAMLGTPNTTASQLEYIRRRVAEFGATGIPIEWDKVGICLVQIATAKEVFIIDLKAIKGAYDWLNHRLSRLTIPQHFLVAKVGTGFISDGKVIFQDLGCDTQHFVDVGFMIRLVNPEPYARTSGPVSLENCVRDALHLDLLNKIKAKETKWNGTLQDSDYDYAALDAQASRDVYTELILPLRQKEQELGRIIPNDWWSSDENRQELHGSGMPMEVHPVSLRIRIYASTPHSRSDHKIMCTRMIEQRHNRLIAIITDGNPIEVQRSNQLMHGTRVLVLINVISGTVANAYTSNPSTISPVNTTRRMVSDWGSHPIKDAKKSGSLENRPLP
ncbi:hypothetical protein DFH09DRAFT_1114754 [Mycena vulgaris]|nr:hypothetical protein DFH09DRAFT_1114754 [Mycena vulgaris]